MHGPPGNKSRRHIPIHRTNEPAKVPNWHPLPLIPLMTFFEVSQNWRKNWRIESMSLIETFLPQQPVNQRIPRAERNRYIFIRAEVTVLKPLSTCGNQNLEHILYKERDWQCDMSRILVFKRNLSGYTKLLFPRIETAFRQ
jgi:hypothetical protein